jgi:hypothetical protein
MLEPNPGQEPRGRCAIRLGELGMIMPTPEYPSGWVWLPVHQLQMGDRRITMCALAAKCYFFDDR